MQGHVSPALAACLYSLILVVTAFLMARHDTQGRRSRRGELSQGASEEPSVFRGTAAALCIVAIVLPMARVVGTTQPAELLMLGGVSLAAGATMLHVTRRAPQSRSGVHPLRERHVVSADRRAMGRLAGSSRRTDVMPARILRGDLVGSALVAGELVESAARETEREELSAAGEPTEEASTSARVSQVLTDVESVVGDYAHRLGIEIDSSTKNDRHT